MSGPAGHLYRAFDAEGALLYVGISVHPAARLSTHERHSVWWPEVVNVTVERFPSRRDALVAELAAIHAERPRCNVAGTYSPATTRADAAADARHTQAPAIEANEAALPLHGRLGIVAWTVIDAAEFHALNRYRWFMDDKGYARRHALIEGAYRAVFVAREVMGLARGDRRRADHINRDPLDNRRANLRVVTNAQNRQNLTAYRRSSSRFRGVTWAKDKQRWRAVVATGGVTHRLGYFTNEIDAALSAEAFRQEHVPFAQPDAELAAAGSG